MGRKGDEHVGQHLPGCNECRVYAMTSWERGWCTCPDPIVEHLPEWNTDQCGRCGKEMHP